MNRGVAAVMLAWLAIGGCTPEASPKSNQLAIDQTLHIAVPEDIGVFESFDPDQLSSSLDYSIGQNLFDGLFRMDDQLHLVLDLAAQMPIVSADGLTYTIPLRQDARFSNGDPVTASDVVYSWNRAVVAGGPYASPSGFANVFQPVVGYLDAENSVAQGATNAALAGLSAPDPHTVVIRLSTRVGGYFLILLTLPVAWVVDERVIQQNGEKGWWKQASTLIGTGPFKMVSHVPGSAMTFVPVPNWWGRPPPVLNKVELDIAPDASSVLRGYESGRYDLVGLGDYGPDAAGTRLASQLAVKPAHANEVHTFLYGRTEWLGFNVRSGPFGAVNGRLGRLALSQAIDRAELARAVCGAGTLCTPATGGMISNGLDGYLGNGSDTTLRYDPPAARANLEAWDPTRTARKGITYVYLANTLYREVAVNLRDQWRRNLGIDVTLQGYDPATFFYDRQLRDYSLFRGSWSGDYDSPQDWYYNLFAGSGPASGSGYDAPEFVATLTQADGSSGSAASLAYQRADRMLIDQAVIDPLFYYEHTVVMKPYVSGFGANALYEYRWTEIRMLQH